MSKAKKVVVKDEEIQVSPGRAADAVCPAGLAGRKMTLKGCDKYAPRVPHTAAAWEKVVNRMGHRQEATYGQLCEVLAVHATRNNENHHDFIGYMEQHNKLKFVE